MRLNFGTDFVLLSGKRVACWRVGRKSVRKFGWMPPQTTVVLLKVVALLLGEITFSFAANFRFGVMGVARNACRSTCRL